MNRLFARRSQTARPITIWSRAVALAVIMLAAALLPQAARAQGPGQASGTTTNTPSGQPLPRFVSLRAGEVNMRSGPGVQYPVDWVYRRRHLPIEVIAEFQTWRKVRDHQGTQGWVHQTMLDGERTAIVLGRTRTLRAEASSDARALARLEPDVIVRIAVCPKDGGWCRVRAAGFEGWIRRVELWGVRKDEAVE
ncbi:MAG: SH3 domain-containing protein [Alphaproteobacteria bacterium]|tara:strand:- start:12595 stop:13176 length:582 start_codon:yes stop_codon:yes gene_type:complete